MEDREPYITGGNKMKFDEYNVDHLAAYRHLCKNGSWPEGFYPDECEESSLWLHHINARMAVAYVDAGMDGAIFGIPAYDISKDKNKLDNGGK